MVVVAGDALSACRASGALLTLCSACCAIQASTHPAVDFLPARSLSRDVLVSRRFRGDATGSQLPSPAATASSGVVRPSCASASRCPQRSQRTHATATPTVTGPCGVSTVSVVETCPALTCSPSARDGGPRAARLQLRDPRAQSGSIMPRLVPAAMMLRGALAVVVALAHDLGVRVGGDDAGPLRADVLRDGAPPLAARLIHTSSASMSTRSTSSGCPSRRTHHSPDASGASRHGHVVAPLRPHPRVDRQPASSAEPHGVLRAARRAILAGLHHPRFATVEGARGRARRRPRRAWRRRRRPSRRCGRAGAR